MSIRQYFITSPSREDFATREVNESVKGALEKQASQQKAKKRKAHTNFSRDWLIMECHRHNRKDKIAKYLN